MQQRTSQLLFGYWNGLRNGRLAPQRFEIEPAKIAGLLPETFIVECGGLSGYRIRLAGTRICDQCGRELRGLGVLELWTSEDREALAQLLHNVVEDGAVVAARVAAHGDRGRKTEFEMLLLPLIHAGRTVNRILGCLTAIDPPFWLGTVVLDRFVLADFNLVWPDGAPAFVREVQGRVGGAPAPADPGVHMAGDARRRFRVYDGGLSD